MTGFPATCFGPGLLPQGQRVQARFQGDMLIVTVDAGREEPVPVRDVKVSAGGFDGRQMLLSWSTGEGNWSLVPSDAAAADLFAANGPAALESELHGWRRQTRAADRRLRRTLVVLGLFLVSPLLLVLLFLWQSERIAGWAAERIPVSMERQLGEIAFAQFRAGGRPVEEGAAVTAVRALGARLTEESVYDYQWYVMDDPTVNAFAVPGGYVVVHTGLLRAADSAEEVAGVLAHEVQHIERRHSLKGMIHALGWQAVLSVALGDVSGSVWGSMAYELGQLGFGREQEMEADREGLAALREAGIDPGGMLRFFENLSAHESGRVAFLSTHPLSGERLAALQQAVSEGGAWTSRPLPYDWAAIKAQLRASSEPKQP